MKQRRKPRMLSMIRFSFCFMHKEKYNTIHMIAHIDLYEEEN